MSSRYLDPAGGYIFIGEYVGGWTALRADQASVVYSPSLLGGRVFDDRETAQKKLDAVAKKKGWVRDEQ